MTTAPPTTTTSEQTGETKRVDLDPATLAQWLAAGDTVLVDVREPFEHAAERIDGTESMPLGTLNPQALRERYPDKRLVFHCAGGKRSAKAADQFANAQGEQACHLAGGIEAWKLAQLPTQKPQKAGLPVMRQVQIAAGSLVVIGVVLGMVVTPWFLALSAFVGCGLVFAGTTGWCGMAKLLAAMPWNKA